MENNYSVEEILSAIDDLQKIKKEKKIISIKNTPKTDSSIIPKDTLKIIEEEDWRRDKLFSLIRYLKNCFKKSNLTVLESDSHIQALLIGSSADATFFSDELLKRGIYLPAIRPPTVEEGKSRLRISLTVDHEEKDIDYLTNILDMISQNLVQ